jgi:hypothetical protein
VTVEKNIEIDLFSFIKDGTFGNIKIGMSKDEILQIFPSPDDWMHGFSTKYSPIRRYGNFELHFENQRLSFIYNDYLDDISAGDQLKMKMWLFENKNIYLQDILDEFAKQNIQFIMVEGKCFIEIIIKKSNIVLSFSYEGKNNMKKMISITKK